jgi:hypothetical protein
VGGPAALGHGDEGAELGAGGGPEFSTILRANAAAVDSPLGLIGPVPTYRPSNSRYVRRFTNC